MLLRNIHGCGLAVVFQQPVSGGEAKDAYDRLAAVKFREHKCEAKSDLSAAKQERKWDASTAFVERARMLIKRGYTPKVAVELVLHETEIEHRNDSRMMEKAHADAEDFLLRSARVSSEVGLSDQLHQHPSISVIACGC